MKNIISIKNISQFVLGVALASGSFANESGIKAFVDKNPERAVEIYGTRIPGLINDHVVLGTAYNTAKRQFLNHQPILGTLSTDYGSPKFEFVLNTNTSYEDVLSQLNGSIDGDAIIEAVSIGAGAHIAKKSAATEYASSYTFSASTTPKKAVLLPLDLNEGFTLSPVGDVLATDYQLDLEDMAGDEFVTSIEYGAQLFVNMKIEYLNRQDKQDIGGYLDVSVGGIVGVKGELNFISEEVKNSVKIVVRAIQKGGDPKRLLEIIPDNIISCTLDNPEPCFNLFSEAINYAKNQFVYQFDSLSSYNVVNYETSRYDKSPLDVRRLVPEYQDISFARDWRIIEATDDYRDAILDEQRASDLISKYYSWMEGPQREAVETLKEQAYNNAWLYYETIQYCRSHPYGNLCVDYWDRIDICEVEGGCIAEYDRSHLEITHEASRVLQCENARARSAEQGLVSEQTSRLYQNLRWAPVFVDNDKPSEGILEWVACEFALTTYGNHFTN